MRFETTRHPFELVRRLCLFFEDCSYDFELRHPEVRKRISFELKQNLNPRDQEAFSNVIQHFEKAKRIISVLDTQILLEWGERRNQAQLAAKISDCLGSIEVPDEELSDISFRLVERLRYILKLIRKSRIPENPSLFFLIKFRLKFSGLRQEALYLIERLYQHHGLNHYKSYA